jgi:hypothetical protein
MSLDEISSPTRSADAAMAAQEADADTLADFPTRDAFAERVDSPDDFMAGHARIGDAGDEAIHGE